jgi:putative restriction endonuclease
MSGQQEDVGLAAERELRLTQWRDLEDQDELEPGLLRDRGIYRGMQGIWVDKARTATLTNDGMGVTVSILHTGKHYADDLSEDGLIYHYPQTNRGAGRDEAEVRATKNASVFSLPIFVILPGKTSSSRRSVRLGWITDFDDEARWFLVIFGQQPQPSSPSDPEVPFVLQTKTPRKFRATVVRDGQQRFKFDVVARYGCKCAVCDIRHPTLIKAAHICGKSEYGCDDWRNGLPLCANHHDAFDGFLFGIEPGSMAIRFRTGVDAHHIGMHVSALAPLRGRPHLDALAWRWAATLKTWRADT